MIRSLQEVDGLKGDNEDQNIGISIALKAMEAPIRQIVMNAGEEASVVVDKIKSEKGNYGFNAATSEYGDMISMGILDPAKVTRTALQAAGSVAGLMITTEAMVSEIPEGISCRRNARRYASRNGRYGWNDVNLKLS